MLITHIVMQQFTPEQLEKYQSVRDGYIFPLQGRGVQLLELYNEDDRIRTNLDWVYDERFAYIIATPVGTPVVAAKSGIISVLNDEWTNSEPYRGLDAKIGRLHTPKFIEIQHDDDTITQYAHLDNFNPSLTPGAPVSQGQFLAKTADNGWVGPVSNLYFIGFWNFTQRRISFPMAFKDNPQYTLTDSQQRKN